MESADCNLNYSEIIIAGSVSLAWLVILITWNMNSRYLNTQYVNALHKIIGATIMLKFFQVLFSFVNELFCEPSNISQFFNLAEGCIFALFNTFLFMTFLLISKGFCYTREYLDGEELNILVITCGGIYISFCIYLMHTELSIIVILVCVSIIWTRINKNLKEMIKTLRLKIEMMRRNNLNSSLPAAEKKLSMVSRASDVFQLFIVVYIFSYFWVGFMKITDNYSNWDLFLTVSEGNEIISVIAVCAIYWPKYNGLYFELAEYENSEDHRVLEMFEADGKGQDDFSESVQTFILKQPFKQTQEYEDYLVAIPIPLRHHYTQDVPGHLEPLLPNSK